MKNASYRETKYSAEKTSFSNCTAFVGTRCIASGALTQVARKLAGRQQSEPVLVFDDRTGELIEIDLRGTVDEVVKRLTQSEPPDTRRVETEQKRGRGRPKLGVISREVTLLPGQWDWLDEQPEGASSALRRLVYEAKRSGQGKDCLRKSQEAVYRLMRTMAGNFSGFEEALRAFYRRDHRRFKSMIKGWPRDVREHLEKLVTVANQNREPAQNKG